MNDNNEESDIQLIIIYCAAILISFMQMALKFFPQRKHFRLVTGNILPCWSLRHLKYHRRSISKNAVTYPARSYP